MIVQPFNNLSLFLQQLSFWRYARVCLVLAVRGKVGRERSEERLKIIEANESK
jgi:hypothetical protein